MDKTRLELLFYGMSENYRGGLGFKAGQDARVDMSLGLGMRLEVKMGMEW